MSDIFPMALCFYFGVMTGFILHVELHKSDNK